MEPIAKSKRSIMGNLIMISCGLMLMLVINVTAGIIIQYNQTVKNVETILHESLEAGTHMAESGIENLITVIGEHVGDYEFKNGTAEEKTAHAAGIASFDPAVLAVTYIDPDGTVCGEAVPASVTGALKSSSVTMTAPASMTSDFYIAVKGNSGSILAARLKAEKLGAVISGSTNDLFILTPDGTVVAASSKNGGYDAKYANYVQSSGTAVYANPQKQGDSYYCYSARAIDGTGGWTLLIRMKSGDYYNGIAIAVIVDIFVVAVMAFLGTLSVVFLKRKVVNPLNKIRAKIVDMSRGNLSGDELAVRSENELGELAGAVNVLSKTTAGIIDDIGFTAGEIANQNLCVQPRAQYTGDFLPVKNSLESIVSSMKEVVGNVEHAGRQVSNSSAQMSANSAALSQAAAEETAIVSDMSNNLNSIHELITSSADKAAKARHVAEESVEAMNEGNKKMSEMLGAMNYINNTSSEIANIIKTIQDIAFQTNILSLNAAIEAARAGDAGKGFAVVAEEVSLLASKSAEASKSTTELIENSVKAVGHGTVIANDAAAMLESIVTKSKESAALVEEIADDAARQAQSISIVMDGMDRISASVNQVNASAGECEQSSQTLASQSAMLKDTVDKFVTDGSSHTAAAPRPVPQPKPAPATPAPVKENKPVQKKESKPQKESKPTPKPEVKTTPKPEIKPEPKSMVKSEPKPEIKPEPKPATKPAANTAAKSKTINLPGDSLPTAAAPARPKSKTINLPGDDPTSAKAPAKAPQAAAPAKASQTAAPAKTPAATRKSKTITLPGDEKPSSYIPAKSSAPSIKPLPPAGAPADSGSNTVISKATMQPVKHTIMLDKDKY